ncbi:MAG: PRC-barrel domain containing protein [Acidimicrobiia bacterium]
MDIYAYRANVVPESAPPELTGWHVESSDGERIGTVDEATYEPGSAFLVVDSGWIFGKRRLLPAGVVESFDPDAQKVVISMTKHDVKQAPEYDEDSHRADEHGYYSTERNYYENFGSDHA